MESTFPRAVSKYSRSDRTAVRSKYGRRVTRHDGCREEPWKESSVKRRETMKKTDAQLGIP